MTLISLSKFEVNCPEFHATTKLHFNGEVKKLIQGICGAYKWRGRQYLDNAVELINNLCMLIANFHNMQCLFQFKAQYEAAF